MFVPALETVHGAMAESYCLSPERLGSVVFTAVAVA
jgi:hypothetical protein